MKLLVNGMGWVSARGCGMVAADWSVAFGDAGTVLSVPRETIFLQPVKNFGRLDLASRITLIAVSLALRDAGIESSPRHKRNIGIVGTGSDGSLAADIDYYRDYVENGRRLSRANLFIYTLPSSSLGEAAIHFGLTGPLLYTVDQECSTAAALQVAASLVADGSAPRVLAGRTEGERALYLLLSGEDERALCTLDAAAAILTGSFDVDAMVEEFARARG